MSLEYSSRASVSYAEFYRSSNSCTIFIEDVAGRLMYERLIKLVLGESAIHRIFPLGGRPNVLRHHSENKENKENIYIIDGDLDIIGADPISDGNLFQIDAYCIENYICTPGAISSVLEDYTAQGKAEILSEITSVMKDIRIKFVPLFIVFHICHFSECGEITVKRRCLRYLNNLQLERRAIRQDMKHLIGAAIKKLGLPEYRRRLKKLKKILQNDSTETLRIISGKDFIFPMIHKVSEKRYSYKGPCDLLVKQASRYVAMEDISWFAEQLKLRVTLRIRS